MGTQPCDAVHSCKFAAGHCMRCLQKLSFVVRAKSAGRWAGTPHQARWHGLHRAATQ